MTMQYFPFVSIIIPVLNGEQTLEACLAAVQNQSYKGDVEIVVVNDGSTDRTSEIARRFLSVTLLEQKNQGRSAARNNGIEISSGEVIAFTDSDCVPQKYWLENLITRLHIIDRNDGTSKKAGIVSGAITIPEYPKNIWRRLDHQAWAHSIGLDKPAEDTIFGSTANMCIRRSIYRKVGGFDERLLGSEDSDLAFRIHKAGYQNYFEPKAVIVHDHGRSSFRTFLRQRFNYGKWTIQTVLKHKPLPPYSWMFPNNRLLLMLFSPGYAVLATTFTIWRNWRHDLSVLWLSPLHFLGRICEYIGTVVGCGEYQKKYLSSCSKSHNDNEE